MKKTFNINISGAAFIIDEDAFQLLNQYLDTISNAYAPGNEADELLADIEGRIAELFITKMVSPQTIITLKMTEEVIRQIGTPGEFDDMDMPPAADKTDIPGTECDQPTPPQFVNTDPVRRRLYRDSRDKMIGGVCSGIAEYLGLDVTWVRIATVALGFLSASAVVVIYVLLWAIVPEATTPLDFMKMRGEMPTMDNIGKTVTGVFNTPPQDSGFLSPKVNQTPARPKRFIDSLVEVLGAICKGLLVIVGIIALPILVVLAFVAVVVILAMLGCTFAPLDFLIPEQLYGIDGGLVYGVTLFSLVLIFGIPLAALVYSIFAPKGKHINPILQRTMLIIWVVALIAGMFGGYICKRDYFFDLRRDRTESVTIITDSDEEEITDDTDSTATSVKAMTDSVKQTVKQSVKTKVSHKTAR